ncbi:hypothetical protein SDC9_100015 [bioreactor metagenome]|uniref:Fibronectin type-III domain-containing protein n=1 Tax=bioreactor metagenome TaxID=1076179 RepID=A0A645AJD9_9ZZZZ
MNTTLDYAGGSYGRSFASDGITLQPNTRYEVQAMLGNAVSQTWSGSGYFTTLPDFISWQPTRDNTDPTKATVSGTYAGDQPITGATITYGLQSNLSGGTTITLSSGTDFTNTGFSYTLTGLTHGQTYYVRTTVTNASGTTTSQIQSFALGHIVAVKHVDKNGQVIAGAANGDPYSVALGASFTVPTETVSSYAPAYYKVGGTQYDLATAQTITADTTITVYYASTILDISYPQSGMDFFALHTDNGAIMSAIYEFRNLSDLPVQVSFKEMNVIDNAGVTFVSNATNHDEIHLSLLASYDGIGFTNNLNNIVPDIPYGSPHQFGTLDGALVGTAGTTKGYLSIGGHYEGPFPLTPKQLQVEFTFHFLLVE